MHHRLVPLSSEQQPVTTTVHLTELAAAISIINATYSLVNFAKVFDRTHLADVPSHRWSLLEEDEETHPFNLFFRR